MHRIIAVMAAAALLLAAAPEARAAEDNPLRKFARGVGNIFTGWLEVPFQIAQTTETEGSISGCTVGFVKGVTYGIGRTGVGVLEAVTFVLPNHVSNTGANEEAYGPIIEPEFVVFRNADPL